MKFSYQVSCRERTTYTPDFFSSQHFPYSQKVEAVAIFTFTGTRKDNNGCLEMDPLMMGDRWRDEVERRTRRGYPTSYVT